MDNQPQRREGFEQARQEFDDIFTIVVGAVDPEREAWVLHGFEPGSENEKELFLQLQRSLGFDPRIEPERLRDDIRHSVTGARDIQQVLRELTEGDSHRAEKCWTETDIDVLLQRGNSTGLASVTHSPCLMVDGRYCMGATVVLLAKISLLVVPF